MSRLPAFVLAAWFAMGAAWAQDDDQVASQRASIAAARSAAEARYLEREKACYKRFAVNDCLAEAKAERRTALADLRRQQVALDDLVRKGKAAQRQKSLEERDAEKQERLAREQVERQSQESGREQRAAEKSSARASQAAAAPGKAAQREAEVARRQADNAAARERDARQAAERAAEHRKRVAEAQERSDKLKERLAQQKKPPAKPLPVPE